MMEWISVEDRLPEEADGQILVCIENGLTEIVWISDENKATRKPFAFDEYDRPIINYDDITHWMEIKPPTT